MDKDEKPAIAALSNPSPYLTCEIKIHQKMSTKIGAPPPRRRQVDRLTHLIDARRRTACSPSFSCGC
jgi:hypothetical protein